MLEEDRVGAAEGIGGRRQRPAVEGHIVERGDEEGLRHEVGPLRREGRGEEVETAGTVGCRSQQKAAVGKRDDGLAEALPTVHQVATLHSGHLHLLLVALTEDLTVETALKVDFRGADGTDVPALEARSVQLCQEGVELLHMAVGRRHDTEGAAFFDPRGEALRLAGRER